MIICSLNEPASKKSNEGSSQPKGRVLKSKTWDAVQFNVCVTEGTKPRHISNGKDCQWKNMSKIEELLKIKFRVEKPVQNSLFVPKNCHFQAHSRN